MQISGKTLITILCKKGFIVRRQRGSHAILTHASDLTRRCVVPVHGSTTLKPGTLHSILKGARLTTEDLSDTP